MNDELTKQIECQKSFAGAAFGRSKAWMPLRCMAVGILTAFSLMAFTLVACADSGRGKTAITDLSSASRTAGNEIQTVKAGVLTVGMELAYPPFETKDAAGEPSGISPDFSRALADELGLELKIENIAWDGLIPSLQSGKIDMLMSSMTITDKRKESVDFSDPYANAYLALLIRADSQIKTVVDLNQAGRKIAVKTGSTGFYYAQKNLTQAELLSLPDESACVAEVSQGKADAFIYDQLTVYRNWQAHQDTTQAVFIPFQDVENWGIALKKGNESLTVAVNAFIKKYAAAGGWDTLTQKYLAEEKRVFDELGFKWFFDLKK